MSWSAVAIGGGTLAAGLLTSQMGGSGGGNSSTQQSTSLTPEQQELLKLLTARAKSGMSTPTPAYPGQMAVPASSADTAYTQYAGGAGGRADATTEALKQLFSSFGVDTSGTQSYASGAGGRASDLQSQLSSLFSSYSGDQVNPWANVKSVPSPTVDALKPLLAGQVPYETGTGYAQDYFNTTIKPMMEKTWEETTLPQLNESFAGPSFWSSGRAEALRKATSDYGLNLSATQGDLMYKEVLADRAAREAAMQRILGASGAESTALGVMNDTNRANADVYSTLTNAELAKKTATGNALTTGYGATDTATNTMANVTKTLSDMEMARKAALGSSLLAGEGASTEAAKTMKEGAQYGRTIEQEKVLADLQRWLSGEQIDGQSLDMANPSTALAMSLLGINPYTYSQNQQGPSIGYGLLSGAASGLGAAAGAALLKK